MEKKLKRIIFILITTIVILLIGIIMLDLEQEEKERKEIEAEIKEAETIRITDIESEQRIYMYLYSNNIITQLFEYISENRINVNNAKALTNLLDSEYMKANNITEDNVLSFLQQYKEINSYFTKEIYIKEIVHRQNLRGTYCYIKGIIRKNGIEENLYVLMKEDYMNGTYSLTFLTEDEFSKMGNDNRDIVIEKNNYNSIYTVSTTDYEICLEYLKDYKNAVNNNPEKAYELLDTEYKEKRFGNVENYKEHINNTKSNLNVTVLKKYSVERSEETTKYVCVDENERYYIFEDDKLMDYKVILDTYTIDLPEFLEKYNKAQEIEKVAYNIEKCIESINNKDYSYIYNKLDSEFKYNNYKTEEEFKMKIQEKLFDVNIITDSTSSNEGDIYIYELKINDNKEKTQNMKIIMKLGQGTDFTMSFSFN